MTGATPEGIELGETMSTALINFARTGKPSAPGLPEWKPATAQEMNTMIWNCPNSKLVVNHALSTAIKDGKLCCKYLTLKPVVHIIQRLKRKWSSEVLMDWLSSTRFFRNKADRNKKSYYLTCLSMD